MQSQHSGSFSKIFLSDASQGYTKTISKIKLYVNCELITFRYKFTIMLPKNNLKIGEKT